MMNAPPFLVILLLCLLGTMAVPLLALVTGNRTLARASAALASLFETLNRGVGNTVIWATLLMALVQMTIVIMRYVFGINFIWLQESLMYLFAGMFLLAGGHVLLVNEHVRVDLFYRTATPGRQALVDFIGTYLFLFPVCLLMIGASHGYVMRSWAILERSTEASGIHAVFLLKSLIPISGLLMILAGIPVVHRAMVILRPRLLPS